MKEYKLHIVLTNGKEANVIVVSDNINSISEKVESRYRTKNFSILSTHELNTDDEIKAAKRKQHDGYADLMDIRSSPGSLALMIALFGAHITECPASMSGFDVMVNYKDILNNSDVRYLINNA